MEATEQVKDTPATDLGALLDAGDTAVVTLVAGDTHLAAHRAVLAARSPVFVAEFQQNDLEDSSGQLTVPGIEGPALRQFLACLYTLQAPQLPSMPSQLLAAADKYDVHFLKAHCEQQMIALLSVESAASTAILAVRHSCDRLKQAALNYIRARTLEVMASEGWADAVRTQPEDVVELSRLLSEPLTETSSSCVSESSRTEPTEEVKEDPTVDLAALLDAGDGAMVTLVAGDTRLVAHRAVLAARSPVFAAKFRYDTLEANSGQFTIPDVEGPVLRQLLAYLYTLHAPQIPSMAPQLLTAASIYGALILKAECERQVVAQLSVETAAASAVLGVRHSCNSLMQAAFNFIRDHTLEVMASQGWADAVLTQPEDVIEVSRLLFQLPRETSAPAIADSGSTVSATQPQSDLGQTPASAASLTVAYTTSIRDSDAAISRMLAPAIIDSGSTASATQPQSDFGQTPASAASLTAAHTTSTRDSDAAISRMLAPAIIDSGSTASATQPQSDLAQTPDSAASLTAAHTTSTRDSDAAVTRMLAEATSESGTTTTASQSPSDLSRISALPATLTAAHISPVPDDDIAISHMIMESLLAQAAEDSGTTTTSQPPIDNSNNGQSLATAALPMAARITPTLDDAAISRMMMCSVIAQAASGSETTRTSQSHTGNSDDSSTPASAYPCIDAQTSTTPNVPAVSWTISEAGKSRRLIEAARKGLVEEVRSLLAAGADVRATDRTLTMWTALHWAADRGHADIVGCLLEAGADVDARNRLLQNTPLHYAAWHGHVAVVQLLLASSADPNARSVDGRTPLHFAAYNGRAETVTVLLEAGADKWAKSMDGHTPLDLARQYGRQQVINILS